MKGLLLTEPSTGSDIVIDVPELLPAYAIGTTVIASILGDNDLFDTIEGDVIGIEILQDMDMKDMTISTVIGYRIFVESTKKVYNVSEDEIVEYYPDSNEHNIAYHLSDGDEV